MEQGQCECPDVGPDPASSCRYQTGEMDHRSFDSCIFRTLPSQRDQTAFEGMTKQ